MNQTKLPDHPAAEAEYLHLQDTCATIDREIAEVEALTGAKAGECMDVQMKEDPDQQEEVTMQLFLAQLNRLHQLAMARRQAYFARLDFTETDRTQETYYLGRWGVLDPQTLDPVVIDWRSPVANLYYSGQIGPMDYEAPDGRVRGELTLKRMLTVRERELVSLFDSGQADILIGTQMIVKGHDFPKVTCVGVLMADLSLSEADYRSGERTFQLITQAVGRAGRGDDRGCAVIQTYHPDHYAVRYAADQKYSSFYKEEIAYRKLMHYPPVGYLLAVLGSSEDEKLLTTGMHYIRKYIDRIDRKSILSAIGPAPQSIGKIRDRYRQVIYLRYPTRDNLIRAKDLLEEYIRINSGFEGIRIEFDFNT